MKSEAFHVRGISPFSITALTVLLIAATSRAQTSGGTTAIDKAVGRTGQFKVTLTQRSPLSKPSDVAERVSAKVSPTEADYDLGKETFDIYVPKSPGEDGKYGLMVVMPFGGHAFPPPPWPGVLEKYHLIFIGDPAAGDGRQPVQRIGLALDAAYGVPRVWPVDENRTYACIASGADLASGIALYYPDVFRGALCAGWSWWEDVRDPKSRAVWRVGTLVRPHPQQLGLARSRSRIFLVGRQEQDASHGSPADLIAKQGYQQAGFKHVKTVLVPVPEMTIWSTYAADWFEQGVQFLDAGPTEANAAIPAAAKTPASPATPATAPARPPAGATSGQAPAADDPAQKAASTLHLAKSYIAAQRYDTARAKLQSIIQSYPQTPAAVEAKSLLKEIQDK